MSIHQIDEEAGLREENGTTWLMRGSFYREQQDEPEDTHPLSEKPESPEPARVRAPRNASVSHRETIYPSQKPQAPYRA